MKRMKLLVCLLGILFLINPCFCFASPSISSNGTLTKEYYATISGQKTWIAVRANFSEPTNISVRF